MRRPRSNRAAIERRVLKPRRTRIRQCVVTATDRSNRRFQGCGNNPSEIEQSEAAESLGFTKRKMTAEKSLTKSAAWDDNPCTLGLERDNMSKEKRAALYVRVSTDRQTVENQIRELTTIAERRGWRIVETYQDAGISGAKGREERPGLDQMLKDARRHKFDVVLTWALDRLGRNLGDVLRSVEHLNEFSIGLYIEKFSKDEAVDTTSPSGKLMFTIFAGIAEFERGMMIQRVRAGIKRAKAANVKFGRPAINKNVQGKIRDAIEAGDMSLRAIADKFKVNEKTVRNIRDSANEAV